jgi:mannosylglycoprotein endo-beta-mannosidase
MSMIDAFFCNEEWDTSHDDHILHALSSSLSDHCPLLLASCRGPKRPHSFRFEDFWTRMPGFSDTVQKAWAEPTGHVDPYHILHSKLTTTGKRLKLWSKGLFSTAKIQLHMALHVILHLDRAMDSRLLSPEETDIRTRLKRRIIGLAALERARKKQRARINDLRDGDANTKFFHRKVNARRRKNFILKLRHNNGWATSHEEKQNIAQLHFKTAIGHVNPRTISLNWSSLDLPTPNLAGLDDPFSEEEVKKAIFEMPSDKAPGPDGFNGKFFKACWDIIKVDVMAVVQRFSDLRTRNLHWLNTANIVLIPKKDGAEEITDYRPISLIHGFAKIVAKVLSMRLAPRMNDIVSHAQSAFIKSRSIHENFLFVRNYARWLHRRKKASLLFKLDIRKAFDHVRWDYILELLQRLGFPPRFRDWIVALFGTSSSRILLNGVLGNPIMHGRGLRQGDPLSPLLFDIAIDPLQRILHVATDLGLLTRLPGRGARFRTSLYADDAAIFMAPVRSEISSLAQILSDFGNTQII